MDDLVLDFESETENGNAVYIEAKFEAIYDFEAARYSEKKIMYWHLIALKITHSKISHYTPTDSDYAEFEEQAKNRAAKEAA